MTKSGLKTGSLHIPRSDNKMDSPVLSFVLDFPIFARKHLWNGSISLKFSIIMVLVRKFHIRFRFSSQASNACHLVRKSIHSTKLCGQSFSSVVWCIVLCHLCRTQFYFVEFRFFFIFFNFACKSFLQLQRVLLYVCHTPYPRPSHNFQSFRAVFFFFSLSRFLFIHFSLLFCSTAWRSIFFTSVRSTFYQTLHYMQVLSCSQSGRKWCALAASTHSNYSCIVRRETAHMRRSQQRGNTVLTMRICEYMVNAQFMLRDCIHYLDTTKMPCAELTFYWPTTRPVQIF